MIWTCVCSIWNFFNILILGFLKILKKCFLCTFVSSRWQGIGMLILSMHIKIRNILREFLLNSWRVLLFVYSLIKTNKRLSLSWKYQLPLPWYLSRSSLFLIIVYLQSISTLLRVMTTRKKQQGFNRILK